MMAEWNFSHPGQRELFDLFRSLLQQNFERENTNVFWFDIDCNNRSGRRINDLSYEPRLCRSTGLLS